MRYDMSKFAADIAALLGETPCAQHPQAEAATPADIIQLKAPLILGETGSRLIMESHAQAIADAPTLEATAEKTLMPCGLYACDVRLPADTLRIVGVTATGTGRSADETYLPDSRRETCQWSAEPGIAGSPDRPKAYLAADSGGLRLRLIGSATDAEETLRVALWRVPAPGDDGSFLFPEALYPSLAAAAAAKFS